MPEQKSDPAYRKLCDIMMIPKNKESLDILKSLYAEDDAELLTAGPFTVVQMDRFTIEDYAAKTGRPVEDVKEAFERLAKRGVLFWVADRKDPGKKKYLIPPLFPGLVEYFIISPHNSIDERRTFVKRLQKLEEGGFAANMMSSDFRVLRVIPSGKPAPEARVVEIDEKLEPDKSQVYAYQDVEQIIREAGKTDKNMAVMPCTCRLMTMMARESADCDATVENCLSFGPMANYVVGEGFGRNIDVEEGLEILAKAEKEGLIHVSSNTIAKQGFICNCCTCCCPVVGSSVKMNRLEAFQKSDYVPVVDQDACTKCRKCVKICGFHALLYRTGEKEDKSEDRVIVREDACIGCGVCASNCPEDAITLKRVRNNEPAKTFHEGVLRMLSGKAD
jgi:Pyruvate/2-oxoacid:ferredoxin oxidoreductase delta subunit